MTAQDYLETTIAKGVEMASYQCFDCEGMGCDNCTNGKVVPGIYDGTVSAAVCSAMVGYMKKAQNREDFGLVNELLDVLWNYLLATAKEFALANPEDASRMFAKAQGLDVEEIEDATTPEAPLENKGALTHDDLVELGVI